MNRLIAILICGLLLPLGLASQSEVMGSIQLDSTDLLIGDQVHGRIILNAPEGQDLIFPAVATLWKDKNYEIVQITDQLKSNGEGGLQIIKQEFVLSFWDTGSYQLPALPFAYTNDMQADTVWAESPVIKVRFPDGITGDSSYIAPIKPILEEHLNIMDYLRAALPYIVVTLLLLAVAFGVYFLTQWQQAQQSKRKKLSPEALALKQLNALQESSLLAERAYPTFHTQISLIIRTYLNGRFGIKALESPTSEILPQVTFEHLEESLILELKEVLETADLVKFAKASPLDQANLFAMDFIRKMIAYVQRRLDEEKFVDKKI